mgnify:FL=1
MKVFDDTSVEFYHVLLNISIYVDIEHSFHIRERSVFFMEFLNIEEIKKINTGHKNEYIEHILKGEGKISLISGAPKSGKSTLALNFAKCIASGTPFLGFKTRESSVLYISLDSEADTISQKINAMNVKSDLKLYFVTDVYIQLGNDDGLALNEDVPTLLEVLQEAMDKIKELKVVVIDMFDNIRTISQYNEYSNEKLRSDLDFVKGIAKNLDLHILLLNHDRKQGASNAYNVSIGGTKLVGLLNGSFIHLSRARLGERVAKIEIGGRNVEEQVLNVYFDSKTCKFEKIPDEEYKDIDPDIAKVRNFIQIKKEFSGTMSELCALVGLSISATSLGRKIKNNLELLYSEGIRCEKDSGHANGRLYSLTLIKND